MLRLGFKRSQHITAVLAALYWLPVSFRIDFKIYVFKASNGQTPAYIWDLLSPYEPDRCLASSSRTLFKVPMFCLVSKGDWALAVQAPQIWNVLHGWKQTLYPCFLKLTFILGLLSVVAFYPN